MRDQDLTSIYTRWTRPSYEVRVRNTMYLWGSAGIKTDRTFDKPLVLHIRNDLFGERICIGTETASGTKTAIGTLDPGQCVSLPVQGISGVFASCDLESVVGCLIQHA